MVALNTSETELTDLIQVELPWSVPTAGTSMIHFFIELLTYLFAAKGFNSIVLVLLPLLKLEQQQKLDLRCDWPSTRHTRRRPPPNF